MNKNDAYVGGDGDGADDDDPGDFKVVKSTNTKQRKARRALVTMATHSLAHIRADAASQFVESDIVRDLNRLVSLYSASPSFAALRDAMVQFDPRALVCFGVGSLTLSPKARAQVACFVALARAAVACSDVQLFEPLLCDSECQLLRDRFAINVLSTNDEGRRAATDRTLFFMPHCPRGLYHNLVQANIRAQSLHNVMLVGNSFAQYDLLLVSAARSLVELLSDRCAIEPLPRRLAMLAGAAMRDQAIHTFTDVDIAALDPAIVEAPAGDRELVSAAEPLNDTASPPHAPDCT